MVMVARVPDIVFGRVDGVSVLDTGTTSVR